MLQRIRDGLHGRKWLAWLALAPIALIFVFWGGCNSLDFRGVSQQDAAEVDGEKIPAAKATKMWSQHAAAAGRSSSAPRFPTEQRTRIQENILDQLVVEQLLENTLQGRELSRQRRARPERDSERQPAFKGPDGKYDAATRAPDPGRSNNITEQEFFDETRSQLLVNQLSRASAARTS